MLLFHDNEDRKQYILRQAARTRAAADHIKDLKPVILDYDGKVYNKRFDDAIRALGDHETTYTTRAGDYRYEIEIYPADLIMKR